MTTAPSPTPLDQARATLRERFGHADFRPGQARAVEAVLAGRDTLVILPTGGGKSVCYQVPAMQLDGLTVVLSPLISLMKDQVDALDARGIPATFINSSLSQSEIASRLAQVHRGEIKLLYLAPERFDAGTTAERLRNIGVSLLAIDEAHCISEWGHDFRPSYRKVRDIRARLGAPPTVALTATATPDVRQDIARVLGLRDPEVVLTGFDRPNLRWHVVRTKNDAEKDGTLVSILRDRPGLAVVYASTRKTVERVAHVLQKSGIAAVAYHAGLDDEHRRSVQDDFMNERARVIVATNAFGMGIDKPNVRLVVHHAMPGSLEAYYQEAGRAGRDGLTADCFLLHAFQDRFTHEFFIKGASPEQEVVADVYATACRKSAADGSLTLDAAELASAAKGKVSDREVESAMRILRHAGAVVESSGDMGHVRVRLLATPERIKEELGDGPSMELDLLRALWRMTKGAVADGVALELDRVPPGLGGAMMIPAMLDALQDKQMLVWSRVGEGTSMVDRKAPLSRWPVDWETLERRRKAELSQLEMVQKYAYTDRCRRGFVLRYFGDPAATATCQQCDNCLHLGHSAVSAVPPAGSKGVRKMTGPNAGRVVKGGPAKSAELPDLTEAQEALLARLRELRSTLSKSDGVPAYVVFPDRTLREMARLRPRTPGALGDVHGVGPTKMERYGEQFLELLRNG
jgi:ATP-dependent DNA helicase RecQ